MRSIPRRLLIHMLSQVEKARKPIVVYVHNWELDASIRKMPLPPLASFYCYYNISGTMSKLRSLLENFEFTSFAEVIKEGAQRSL